MRYFVFIVMLFVVMGCRQEPTLTFVFVGDLMPDRGIRKVIEQKGIDALFERLPYNLNTVDYTVANLECAVCDTTLNKENKRYTFRANPEWLQGFRRNGINIVSVANNHSGDYGENGFLQTLYHVRKSAMYAVGGSAQKSLSGAPLIVFRGKIRVALFSSDLLKSGNPYMCHASVAALKKRVNTFKAGNPDTQIIVLLHWGVEGKLKPESKQIQEAHSLIDAGADVLIGTHPHVVQPMEQYKKGLIFYSLGNFVFDNRHTPENTGMMVRLKIGAEGITAMDTTTYKVYTGYGSR